MEIFGWRLQWPMKVIYVRGRGFGRTWRGWPLQKVRVFGYAPLAGGADLSVPVPEGVSDDEWYGMGPEIVYGPNARRPHGQSG